jgi:hypothetical protein
VVTVSEVEPNHKHTGEFHNRAEARAWQGTGVRKACGEVAPWEVRARLKHDVKVACDNCIGLEIMQDLSLNEDYYCTGISFRYKSAGPPIREYRRSTIARDLRPARNYEHYV